MITLKKNFEFKRVLSRGKCLNGKMISIYFFPNKLKLTRVGFAVGKKAGMAVQRNRIRRVIKEAVRLTELKDKCGYDLVFVWKNRITADKVQFCKIKKELDSLIKEDNKK